jgi:RNA polymerase sigma-70 factor (ECF subfamily)
MTTLEGKALLDHGKAIAKRYARQVGVDAAEELRAEAVLRALASPPPDGRMEPWLERIYRNLLVDRWRRGKTAARHAVVERFAAAWTPEDQLLGRERRRVVRESLRQLPRETRRALLTRYYGEFDDNVAAARLGIATATVRTRIHRALALLRARLGDVRAWCPPIFGKLGTQVATVGLAPVLVAVFVVAGAVSSPQEPIPESPVATPVVNQPAHVHVGKAPVMEPQVAFAPPSSSPRVAKRAATVTPTAAPSPVTTMVAELGNDEAIVREILYPDSLDVFAEPERPARPCMVEAPPSFLAQIEKMMDDRL